MRLNKNPLTVLHTYIALWYVAEVFVVPGLVAEITAGKLKYDTSSPHFENRG